MTTQQIQKKLRENGVFLIIFTAIVILLGAMVINYLSFHNQTPASSQTQTEESAIDDFNIDSTDDEEIIELESDQDFATDEDTEDQENETKNQGATEPESKAENQTITQVARQATTNTSKINTYTNQYYPNLRLPYNTEQWSMSTDTYESGYEGLLSRDIVFMSKNAKVTVNFYPIYIPSGCGGGAFEEAYTYNKQVGSHHRIKHDYRDGLFYSYESESGIAAADCHLTNRIQSNINTSFVNFEELNSWGSEYDYEGEFRKIHGNKLKFNYKINLEANNSQGVKEADELVRKFSF